LRWAPLHPRQLLAIAVSTLALACMLMLAAATDLGTLDFSIGSSSHGSGSTLSPPTTTAPVEATAPREPTWVSEPLAPPIESLNPAAASR
jgi:hypothetical protein